MKLKYLRKLVNNPYLNLPDDFDILIDGTAEDFNLNESFIINSANSKTKEVWIKCQAEEESNVVLDALGWSNDDNR